MSIKDLKGLLKSYSGSRSPIMVTADLWNELTSAISVVFDPTRDAPKSNVEKNCR